MKIVDEELKWLNEVIEAQALELQHEKKPDGWFSISSISKVPYIPFPNLSKEECVEIQEQAMEVLRTSIRQNNYKEVAITYSLTDTSLDKYIVTNGELGYVHLMSDERVKDLLFNTREQKELVVISLHNHPNDGFFSINDLITFTENPSIRIMEIVNTKGEVAFLMRPKFEIYHCVAKTILNAEPDYVEKKNIYQANNEGELPKISDIIPNPKIRNEIVRTSVFMLEENGVYVSNYINIENAQYLDFSHFKAEYEKHISADIKDSKLNKPIRDFEYLENGEDGYEWEK